MMNLNMESLFNPQRIMQDFHHHDHDISNSCSSSSSSIKEEEEDNEEEVNSSSTPLQDMSSLLLQLPLKRGLSRYYNGKSQSFTSLTNVKCLEDLAKQENPFNKRLKTCKSYAGFPRNNHYSSRKKPSNLGSHFSSNFDGGFLENNSNNSYYTNDNIGSNMAPITPPQRSTSTSRLIY